MKIKEIRIADKGVFTIQLWPTITTIIMLVVLIGLGTWQVQRLHWKENLLAEIKSRLEQAPVDATTITDPANNEYRRISAIGSIAPGQELYMHAMSTDGEGGYHILVPMLLNNGQYLLVDRGWVPLNMRDPQARPGTEIFGASSVNGLLRVPHPYWMQPKNHPEANDWYGVDLKAMADTLGLPDFLPYVLEADTTPNPGGYPIGGQTHLALPNNHLLYSIIWFSLALMLLIIYGKQGWKPSKGDVV